ncbi:MAG TPA: ABC transporter permease [Vicinamibacterales bacterium]|jgi:cell division transport system permease protein|nr:ABC transporter permease [Vicinamibacterales bacterium]
MRALQYFFREALGSLWRARGAALLAIATIGVGLFVLGFFLLVNTNVQRVVDRWSESAEVSVFLEDAVTAEQLKSIDELVAQSRLAARREYISKQQALERFKADFPDLAPAAASTNRSPLPASFELQLRSDVREASGAVNALVASLSTMAGVADVRYDRQWLERLNAIIRGARIAGAVVVAMLAFAAAMTVANVVRLAATARRDEIEIMQLVGAPFAYVRGPFVAEGILQGGAGAILAIGALAVLFQAGRLRFELTFLSFPILIVLLLGGMAVGCLGGYVVARHVR